MKIIKTKREYQSYLNWVDKMFDKKTKINTPEGEILQVALLLIKQYEDEYYPISIPIPDSIDAIKMKIL